MTRAAPELVVPDTSCLIALAGIGRLDVLQLLYAKAVVPVAVRREYGGALPGWIHVDELGDSVRPLVRALSTMLGPGESEAIALAADRPGALVVLDDLRARRIARDMGVRLTGTVGVLLRAKREGVVPSVGDALARAEAVGFRVSSALRDEACAWQESRMPAADLRVSCVSERPDLPSSSAAQVRARRLRLQGGPRRAVPRMQMPDPENLCGCAGRAERTSRVRCLVTTTQLAHLHRVSLRRSAALRPANQPWDGMSRRAEDR